MLRRLFQQCRSHLCPCTERLKRSPHHSKLRYSASLHACKSMRNTQLVSLFGKTSNSNRAHKHKSSTKSTAAFIKTEIQKPQPQQKSQMQPPTVEQHQSQHSQKAETTPTNATAPMGFGFVPPVPPAAFCPSSQQCFGRIAFWTMQRGVPFVMNSPIFVIENHGNVSFVNLVNMTAPLSQNTQAIIPHTLCERHCSSVVQRPTKLSLQSSQKQISLDLRCSRPASTIQHLSCAPATNNSLTSIDVASGESRINNSGDCGTINSRATQKEESNAAAQSPQQPQWSDQARPCAPFNASFTPAVGNNQPARLFKKIQWEKIAKLKIKHKCTNMIKIDIWCAY